MLLMMIVVLLSNIYGFCEEPIFHIGDTVKPIDVRVLLDKLSKINTKKDEFETQADYEARLSHSAKGLDKFFVINIPFNTSSVSYDAENKRLNFDYNLVGYIDKSYFATLKPVQIIVSEKTTKLRSYKASNAYGATTIVDDIRLDTIIIFDRDKEDNYFQKSPLFSDNSTDYVLSIESIEPIIAKNLKTRLRSAAVVKLKSPYYTKKRGLYKDPTRDFPYDISGTDSVIYADINSVLILDGNKVVSIIQTR